MSCEKRLLTKIIIEEQIILMPLYKNNLNNLFWITSFPESFIVLPKYLSYK